MTALILVIVILIVANILDAVNVINLDGLAKRLPSNVSSILLPGQNYKRSVKLGGSDVETTQAQPELPSGEEGADTEGEAE